MNRSADLERTVRELASSGVLDLPHPGAGRTAERWLRLAEIARGDVAVARLVEAHVDATSILHDAGRDAVPGAIYGVWAAEESGRSVQLRPGLRGRTRGANRTLAGAKPFCTGAELVDRALVTARDDGGVVLVDVDARDPSISYDSSEWSTPALDATCTATATFDGVTVADDEVIGGPGWYLERVGFWHGACGPAACWAGGVARLVDRAVELAGTASAEPHRDAHLGALVAIRWELSSLLERAGHETDAAPADLDGARSRARALRHLVDRSAGEAIDRFGRAFGPRPLIRDRDVIRRIAEVQLYVRQCHAERDLEALGRDTAGRSSGT